MTDVYGERHVLCPSTFHMNEHLQIIQFGIQQANPPPTIVEFDDLSKYGRWNQLDYFSVNKCTITCKMLKNLTERLNYIDQTSAPLVRDFWEMVDKCLPLCVKHNVEMDVESLSGTYAFRPNFGNLKLDISANVQNGRKFSISPRHQLSEMIVYPTVQELVDALDAKLASSPEIARCKSSNAFYRLCNALDEMGIPDARTCKTIEELYERVSLHKKLIPDGEDFEAAAERFDANKKTTK